MKTITCLIFLLAPIVFYGSAKSQEIYRCGKVYQDSLCTGGKQIDTSNALGPFQMPKSTLQADADRRSFEESNRTAGVIGGDGRTKGMKNAQCDVWANELKQIERDASNPGYNGYPLIKRRDIARKEREKLFCDSISLR